jgi:uncharacterized membrane protein YgcG
MQQGTQFREKPAERVTRTNPGGKATIPKAAVPKAAVPKAKKGSEKKGKGKETKQNKNEEKEEEEKEEDEGGAMEHPFDLSDITTPKKPVDRKLGEEYKGMGPETPMNKLMATMSAFAEKMTGTIPREVVQKFDGDDVYTASFKRKLALREHITEADTTDPVKIAAWLQWAASLVRRGSTDQGLEYSSACHALLNTASTLSIDDATVKTLEYAVEMEICDTYVWQGTCRNILMASVPNAVSQAEAAISGTPPRKADESISSYFARKVEPINHAQFIRKVLGKDDSGDWLRPHLDKWALGLGDVNMAPATVTLPQTATLRDFFDTVQKVNVVLPVMTPKKVHFNMINEQDVDKPREETSTLDAISAAINNMAHDARADNRLLTSRLNTIESRNTPNVITSNNCGKRGHIAFECRGPGGGASRGGGARGRGGSRGGRGGGDRGGRGNPRPMVCYNCQDEGHMSRECSKPCSLCSATDHTSATCEKKGEKRKDPPSQGKDPKNE